MARVCVYRNLNARSEHETWTVATVSGRTGKGTKLRGAAAITLANVVMVVQPKAACDIANGANRAVHAWFVGDVVALSAATERKTEIAYNPKARPQWLFFHTRDGKRIDSAALVALTADGRAFSI